MKLLKLGWIDVYRRFVRFTGEILRSITCDCKIEAYADSKENVAILQGEIGSTRSDGARTSHKSRVVTWDKIGRAPRGNRGDV